MDLGEVLWPLLGVAALAAVAGSVGGGDGAAADPVLVPSGDSAVLEPSPGLSGLGGANGGWYDLNAFLKINIPFPTRTVSGGVNSGKLQFQYQGRWYDGLNLLKVWNPIRTLPGWMR
jgi:hypothetical protein